MGSSARIAVLGGGRMGEALVSGLLRTGHDAGRVTIAERYPQRAQQLRDSYGVTVCADAASAVADARVIILAVKPADVDAVLAEVAQSLGEQALGEQSRPDGPLLVSVAAGVSVARLEQALPDGVTVIRAMPNTPALVGEAMTAIAGGTHTAPEQLDVAEELLGAVGKVVRVDETQLDAVTAVSGSGPAYFFLLVEAMIDGGVLLGLPRPLATELIVQTALGAATMMRDSGQTPVELRAAVSSPGGTTVAGTRAFEVHGIRAAAFAALEAAAARSHELGSAD